MCLTLFYSLFSHPAVAVKGKNCHFGAAEIVFQCARLGRVMGLFSQFIWNTLIRVIISSVNIAAKMPSQRNAQVNKVMVVTYWILLLDVAGIKILRLF